MPDCITLLSGNSHKELAQEVSDKLGIQLADAKINTFSDGEISVQIDENVRGADVFILQSTCSNDYIIELLLIIDALKRASAGRINAVIPYFGYARQDRKVKPRVPISSKLMADLLTAAGTQRLITIELHAGQIQGFFNIPVDHLYAMPVMLDYLKGRTFKDLVVVSPDAGGVERARALARRLDASLAIVDKRRERANESQVMNVIGEVRGSDVLLVDDMIDTAGTMVKAAEALKEKGALKVYASCTHAVLSGPAIERINDSFIDEMIVTNTIPLDSKLKACKKLKALSVAPLLAEAVKRIHEESSISSLFV